MLENGFIKQVAWYNWATLPLSRHATDIGSARITCSTLPNRRSSVQAPLALRFRPPQVARGYSTSHDSTYYLSDTRAAGIDPALTEA